MGIFDYLVVGSLFGLIGVVWHQLDKRIDSNEKHIGIHYSKISDLRADMTGMQMNINNHADKFDEMHASIINLHDMIKEGLEKLSDKLDGWRERRQ